MAEQPLYFSVLLPVYNTRTDWLELAISSILEQTYPYFELLIMDDGSNEETCRYLEEKAKTDSRIRIEHNPHNMGLSQTLNRGLKLAKYRWVARMDGDDISLPNRLEIQARYLRKYPDLAVLGGTVVEMGGTQKISRGFSCEDFRALILWGSCLSHPSVVLSKSKVLSIGGYPNVQYAEDIALWLKLAFDSSFQVMAGDRRILQYRVVKGRSQYERTQKQSHIEVLRSYIQKLNLPVVPQVFYSPSWIGTLSFPRYLKLSQELMSLKSTKFTFIDKGNQATWNQKIEQKLRSFVKLYSRNPFVKILLKSWCSFLFLIR